MRILRKIVGWLPYVGAMLVMIAVFEWFYYHVQGKSAVWGLNPRCIEPGSSGYCWKLDTSNMPWDATLATWLAQGAWYFALLAAFALSATLLVGAVAGAILLARVAASPHQERLSLLADSRWLPIGTAGLIALAVAGVALAAMTWTGMMSLAALIVFVGLVPVFLGYGWSDEWASRYRHERFLANLERDHPSD